MADYIPTSEDMATMEQAARKFSGAWTGTSGTLASYVILLLQEVRRLRQEVAVERAKREQTQRTAWAWPFGC